MEICEYNFLFIIMVLNSVTLMYLEFSATLLAIKTLLDSEPEIEITYKVT